MVNVSAPLIDATVFMGMHHADPAVKQQSLAFFGNYFDKTVKMNFAQIGLCDAVIWKKARALQDVYYPFMDVLHTDMNIERQGYCQRVLDRAAQADELLGLDAERKLLAAQVLEYRLPFFTHDPRLTGLAALQPYLQPFPPLEDPLVFPAALQALYQHSTALVVAAEDLAHV